MKILFDNLSDKCSKITTKEYSTSFSLGILFLSKKIRQPIYNIYGFVRFADEIVDSFGDFDRKTLLQKFKDETYEAIENKISLNPILNSFQKVVNKYNINLNLIESFFESMEMDLDKVNYSQEKYEKYIYGSAEVVGLMCLYVFTEGNIKLYNKLEKFAKKLGSAFQKINFLRDLKADYQILGRNYFPEIKITQLNNYSKSEIEKDIEFDFEEALKGIKQLPNSSRGGVYLAYVYYYALFKKIKKVTASKILNSRIRIGNLRKISLMINSMFQYKLNMV